MLHVVDGRLDGAIGDPIIDVRTPCADDGEYARAASRRAKSSRTTGAFEDDEQGQGADRNAGKVPTTCDERGALLRDLADDAGRWRAFDRRNPQAAPRDDLLEDILLGRANLAQLAPVSDLFVPILWFAPLIDRDRRAWIARGMPGQQAGGDDAPRAARLRSWLDAVRAWSPAPFAAPIVAGCQDVIACHLFTGVSSLTADLGHVR